MLDLCEYRGKQVSIQVRSHQSFESDMVTVIDVSELGVFVTNGPEETFYTWGFINYIKTIRGPSREFIQKSKSGT
jgi:hypothetical protein